MAKTSGTIKYSSRGFLQDSSQAMGGDIVRALVELITNCDDAYGTEAGQINIEVIRSDDNPTMVVVRDTATGLTPDQMKNCFTELAAQTSGFTQGARVRGLLGRGAKDTACFGRTRFETIKDDVYSWLELKSTGDWDKDEMPATSNHRDNLEIPEGTNGLVATIYVERPGLEPRPNKQLVDRLSKNVQLRQITTERTVLFGQITNGKHGLTQTVRWNEPDSVPLEDLELNIDGYDTTARLRLFKLTTPGEGRVDSHSRQGIEVRGSKATYDNTFFGENAVETSWIRGIVDCDLIDDLIRTYEKTQGTDTQNPTPLLRRDRDGLDKDHPFYQALGSAVLVALTPILEDLRPTADTTAGGDELRKDLQRACRDLDALLAHDLDEIDEVPHKGGTTPTAASPLILIPPRLKMTPESKRSLTVLIKDDSFPDGIELSAAANPARSLDVVTITKPRPHAVYPNMSIATVRVEARQTGNVRLVVEDKASSHTASSDITIQETIAAPDAPPETLEWKNEAMSVTVEKVRPICLRAPIELAPTGSLVCDVLLDGAACELIDDTITLEQVDLGWLEGTCKIKGLTVDQTCTITARGAAKQAVGTVRVNLPSSIGGLGTEMKIEDREDGSVRGRIEQTDAGWLIRIWGKHRGLANLLGRRRPDGSYQHEQERHVRIALSGTIASVIADWLLDREADRYPQDFRDVDAMLPTRNRYVERYLDRLQNTLAR